MSRNLLPTLAFKRLNNAVAAGTDDITSSGALDMQGYLGALLMVAFGAITTNAVTSVTVLGSNNGSDYEPLEGATVTVADDDDNKLVVVDVYRPRHRYLKVLVDRGTQNAVVDGIFGARYGGSVEPAAQDATVKSGGVVVTPEAA